MFVGPFWRCAPAFQFGREPIPNAAFLPAFALPLVGPVVRLMMGREKLRGGGAEALIPAFAPSRVAAVGFMSSERTGLTLLSSFGETRMALRATFCELSSV